jgi:hypothetical protein
MSDMVTVRFRVGDVYKGRYVSVYYDDTRVMHLKKKVLAPGEMEQVILQKNSFGQFSDVKTITVKTEEA